MMMSVPPSSFADYLQMRWREDANELQFGNNTIPTLVGGLFAFVKSHLLLKFINLHSLKLVGRTSPGQFKKFPYWNC